MAKIKNDGTWFIKFPTYRYNEDVKKLAKRNDLYIIDEKYQGDMEQCSKPPKITVNEAFTPGKTKVQELQERIDELEASAKKES